MSVIKYLFEMISLQDPEIMRIFLAWIQNARLEEIRQLGPA